jgi:hypothetical protein
MCVVASTAVGAADTFVQDGYNGRIVATGSVDDLAMALREVSALPDQTLLDWSDRSRAESKRLSPQLWVDQLVTKVAARQAGAPT